MVTPALATAPTRFLQAGEQRYAYRRNSYWLGENLPNAMLLTYPDSGHGSLFQFHESFTRHASAFLDSDSPFR